MRIPQQRECTTTSFTLNSDDELTASSGGFTNSYGYNANGEQTSRTLSGTAYTLSYDYDGQLSQIVNGNNTTSFAYDGAGRRYSRTSGGTTTEFQYGGGNILREKQGSTYTATYTYGNGLIRKDGEYPLFDGQGSERTVTNSSQTATGGINFDSFGNTAGTSGSSSNPYMYSGDWGYRNDGDAGLTHVGARYYDAQAGRFITRDTFLNQHPYLYCVHDPVNGVDPSGHSNIKDYVTEFIDKYGDVICEVIAKSDEDIGPAIAATLSPILEVIDIGIEINEGYEKRAEFIQMRNEDCPSWIATRPDTARPSSDWRGNDTWNPNDPDDNGGPGGIP